MDQEEQKIESLTPADEARLAEQRRVVEKVIEGNPDAQKKYLTSVGKLDVLRAILEGSVFKPDQTYELQCMGIVLGDVFVRELGMIWIMVEDSGGRDPAIMLEGTSIILFPLTMISKRIENGESVDVFDLFNGLAAKIDELRAEGC